MPHIIQNGGTTKIVGDLKVGKYVIYDVETDGFRFEMWNFTTDEEFREWIDYLIAHVDTDDGRTSDYIVCDSQTGETIETVGGYCKRKGIDITPLVPKEKQFKIVK